VNCKGCHASRCYKHILSTYSIHSSVALIAHLADDASATWHTIHRDVRDEYGRDYPLLKAAIRHGRPYPRGHRFAYYASEFAVATPINEATCLGFYDAGVPENRDVSPITFSCPRLIVPQDRVVEGRSLVQRPSAQVAANLTLEPADTSGTEGTSSHNEYITRSRLPQDPGPSTSRKRSLSSQEEDNIPQKRARTLRPAISARTDSTAAGPARGRLTRARRTKAKLDTKASKKTRRSRHAANSTENSSVSLLPSHFDVLLMSHRIRMYQQFPSATRGVLGTSAVPPLRGGHFQLTHTRDQER
jgi:hypothetical protein